MFRQIRCSHLVVCFICLLTTVGSGSAQSPAALQSPAVTAAATGERVRFTAPSTGQQMRLEVYDAVGVKRFDNEVRGGNVLDWRLQDGQAESASLLEATFLIEFAEANHLVIPEIGQR